jgi:hypothetical protein
MASMKREHSEQGERETKKAKIDDVIEAPESKPAERVVLNPADCNLGICCF